MHVILSLSIYFLFLLLFSIVFLIYNESCISILVMQVQNKASISGLHDKGLFLSRDAFTFHIYFNRTLFNLRGSQSGLMSFMAVMISCFYVLSFTLDNMLLVFKHVDTVLNMMVVWRIGLTCWYPQILIQGQMLCFLFLQQVFGERCTRMKFEQKKNGWLQYGFHVSKIYF